MASTPSTTDPIEALLESWDRAIKDYLREEKLILAGERIPSSPRERYSSLIPHRTRRNTALAVISTLRHLRDESLQYLLAAVGRHDGLVDHLIDSESDIDEKLLKNLEESLLRHSKDVRQVYGRWRVLSMWAAFASLVAAPVGLAVWLAAGGGVPNTLLASLGLIFFTVGLTATAFLTPRAAAMLSPRMQGILVLIPPVCVLLITSWLSIVRNDDVEPLLLALSASIALAAIAAYWVFVVAPRRALGAEYRASVAPTLLPLGFKANGDVRAELVSVEDVADRTAHMERRSARWWRRTHYLLGTGAAATAGVVGALAGVPSNFQVVAIISAALAGAATTLNPGKRAEEKLTMAEGAAALAREIRVLTRIDLDGYRQDNEDKPRQALEDIIERYESIVGAPERRTFWSRHGRSQPV